jgi:hypothetical protein
MVSTSVDWDVPNYGENALDFTLRCCSHTLPCLLHWRLCERDMNLHGRQGGKATKSVSDDWYYMGKTDGKNLATLYYIEPKLKTQITQTVQDGTALQDNMLEKLSYLLLQGGQPILQKSLHPAAIV